MNIRAACTLMFALSMAGTGAAAQQTASPHGALTETCSTCHSGNGWKPAKVSATFKHAEKTFPLDGAHLRTSCTSCHKSLEFTKAMPSCASCHSDVHHGEMGTECARCHTSRSFADVASMRRLHETTRFPLRGAHTAATCEQCHAPTQAGRLQFVNRPVTCIGCHAENFRVAKTPDHVGAKLSQDCASCHGVATWLGAKFDHSVTKFALDGAHRTVTCNSCHADKVFVGKPTACVSCHQQTFNTTLLPPHSALAFSTACASCHTTAKWMGANYDHTVTAFPLTGAHRTVSCDGCHADKVYRGKPSTCVSCHQANFAASKNPPHAAAGFPTTCLTCHTTTKWTGTSYNHSTTQFPLTGAHVAALCSSCHADGVYRGKLTTCVSCHQQKFTAAAQPPHAALGFSTVCSTCHTTAVWKPASFDHTVARFQLTGAHRAVSCSGCHADGVYRGKPGTCVSCHQDKYSVSTNPPHAAAGFPTTCEACHTTAVWKGTTFNHSASQFPLTGAHVAALCSSCHADGVYKGKPTTCVSCHQQKYNATVLPPHSSLGFSTVCSTCHTTAVWKPATFDHAATRFQLTGAHRAASCADCHADKVYRGKPMTCVSCHQGKYTASTKPAHAAAGFPTTCESCHTTTMWTGAVFNHNASQFPLTGAHVAALCSSCHADGVYHGKPTTCVSCHQQKYNTALLPPHQSLGFSTVCSTCHTTSVWKPATFDHATTRFALTGAHRAASCANCHADGVYRGKSMLCASCHQAKYTATTTPPHAAAGFPTTCESCHNTTQWPGAVFNHSATRFALTGAHVPLACTSCHGDGVYRGKTMVCSGCHLARYNATTNPNHQAAHFPTTCESCHTTAAWPGATFNHDASFFPIYSGAHQGKWATCATCHTSPTNFAVFTCTNCHLKPVTDSKHLGKAGYVYASPNCYACHPRGRAG